MDNIGYQLLRIGLWCILALFNVVCAAFITLIAALIYQWIFPNPSAWWSGSGLAASLKYFGLMKGLTVFVLSFLIISFLFYSSSRNFDRELQSELARNEADLKLMFGSGSTIEPDGIGYKATLGSGGKQYEANCYTYASYTKGGPRSATSAVTFPVADRTFELSLVQKWGWFSPKEEPPDVVPNASNLLDILQARNDCYCSDHRVIQPLVSDPAVQREIMPEDIPKSERLKITVHGGRASVECSAELNLSGEAARAATYVLMKKLIVKAQVLDAALSRILKNPQQQDA